MKIIGVSFWICFHVCSSVSASYGLPVEGFAIHDSLREVSFRYTKRNHLIILSPIINDTLKVNLILDTGSRNTILFGKRFQKFFNLSTAKTATFSGLGEGKPIQGKVTLGNNFSMNGIVGTNICVIVVPRRQNFLGLNDIDGVIGYDLIYRFEIEVDPARSLITFRPTDQFSARRDRFISLNTSEIIPLSIGEITFDQTVVSLPVLVDTGSELGVLYKCRSFSTIDASVIGKGFNGSIWGKDFYCDLLTLDGIKIGSMIPMLITSGLKPDSVSLGMGFLKDHSFILNLSKGYFVLKS
jgi:hypothetical protein